MYELLSRYNFLIQIWRLRLTAHNDCRLCVLQRSSKRPDVRQVTADLRPRHGRVTEAQVTRKKSY